MLPVLAGLGLATAAGRSSAADEVPRAVLSFFGEAAVRTLGDPATVEIARLRTNAATSSYIVVKASRLGSQLIREFRDVLLDENTYDFPRDNVWVTKLCGGFEPGIALRFRRADGSPPVDVLLCFKCADVGIAARAGVLRGFAGRVHYRQPRRLRIVDMSGGELAFLRLVVRALPGDEELGALLASREKSAQSRPSR